MPISWLDVILIVIMLVSGFLAMVRGFTREVLSIFSWAMAAVAALYLTPKYWYVVEPYFPSPAFAQIGFALGVFIVILIVVSLITLRVSDTVLDSRVGALDRTLGFIFGLARGFLLVGIVFILFSALARDQPEWVTTARSFPILQKTQLAIESLLPMDPQQYLPGNLVPEGQPGEGQADTPAEAAPDAAPATDRRSDSTSPPSVASSLALSPASPSRTLARLFASRRAVED